MRRLIPLVTLAMAAALPITASAQYPVKPIKIVVPVPPGGPSDNAARILGQALTKSLGQPIVVENRPGANGAIAAQAVFGAAPDGYTALWALSSMVALPLLQSSSPYKSLSEYAPVSIVCRLPFAMVIHPSVPASSVAEFVSYARQHPNKLSYATGPLSEFMAGTQFMKATNTAMVRVPYKGGAQVIPDLIEGRIEVYFAPLALALPQARAGKVRILATLLPTRSQIAPEIPTIGEAGISGIMVPSWNAIVMPPRTPATIAARLSRELAKVLGEAEQRTALSTQGLQAEASTPEQLAAALASDQEVWRRFIVENDVPRE